MLWFVGLVLLRHLPRRRVGNNAARVVASPADDARQFWHAAMRASDGGRVREAVRLMERAVALRPAADPRRWILLSRLRRDLPDVMGARRALARGVDAFPDHGELWRKLAEMSRAAGDVEQARSQYARACACDPACGKAWDAWCRMEMHEGEKSAARDVAKRGLACLEGSMSASVPRLWHAYALAAATPQERERALFEGLKCDPSHPHLVHALGLEVYARGNAVVGRRLLERAVVMGHPEAAFSVARVEEKEGRVPQARSAYERACRRPNIAAWRAWARFEQRAGNKDAALDIYRCASARFPTDVELHVQWARLKPPEEARQTLLRVLAHDTDSTRLLHALGDLYATAGGGGRRRALLVARRIYHRGARSARRGRDLVHLLYSWAHCEWALARLQGRLGAHERSGVDGTRRLFARAAHLAQNTPRTRVDFIFTSRARFELAVGDKRSAVHFATKALKSATDDAGKARAYDIIALALPVHVAHKFEAKAANCKARAALDRGEQRHPLKRSCEDRLQAAASPEHRFGCTSGHDS